MKFQFLHIEKTAGMSLHAMLHRDHFFYISPDPRKMWDPDKKSFLSDVSNGGHNIKKSKKFPFQFTIMRDPIDRYLSHFNWRINIMREKWSFEDYLQIEEYKDFQFKKMKSYTNESDFEPILESFSFVGLFEEFEKTLSILSDSLNLDPVPVLENKKFYAQALKKGDLSKSQLGRCYENNALDCQMYQLALERFYTLPSRSEGLKTYQKLPLHVRVKQKSFNLFTRARR